MPGSQHTSTSHHSGKTVADKSSEGNGEEIDRLKSEIAAHKESLKTCRKTIASLEQSLETANAAIWRIVDEVWSVRTCKENVELGETVEALVENHKAYLALIRSRRQEAARICKEAREIQSALRFVGRAASSGSSGMMFGSAEHLVLSIDAIMRQACRDIDGLIASSTGVVNGSQDRLMRDAVAELPQHHSQHTS